MGTTSQRSGGRLRLGIGLFVLSWVPFPLAVLAILRSMGYLQSAQAGSAFVAIMWGAQYLIGFVGLFFAGKESIGVVRQAGWRHLPSACWQALRYGRITNNQIV